MTSQGQAATGRCRTARNKANPWQKTKAGRPHHVAESFAKQSQFHRRMSGGHSPPYETAMTNTGACAKQSQFAAIRHEPGGGRQKGPGSHRSGYAKQSQLWGRGIADCCLGRLACACTKQSQFAGGRPEAAGGKKQGATRAIIQNKANSPTGARKRLAASLRTGAVMRNKANSQGHGPGMPARAQAWHPDHWWPVVRNKANCVAGILPAIRRRGVFDTCITDYPKQSQTWGGWDI